MGREPSGHVPGDGLFFALAQAVAGLYLTGSRPEAGDAESAREALTRMHDHDALDFAELAATLQSAPTPTETAEDIVRYVRAQLDADHAAISVVRSRSRIETIAPTDPCVEELDRRQTVLGEGPCYDGAWAGETLTVSDLAEDERWPTWAAETAALGVTSLLASELTTVEGRRIGCISAYWTGRRCFTQDDLAFMAIFARHAALALTRSWNEAGLNTALDTRKVIGQAQGILMERHGLDEARAFEVLRRYSQDHNIKLRDVAAHLIDTRQLPTIATTTLQLPKAERPPSTPFQQEPVRL
jgi:ANTAR domain/GAF domain